MPLKRLVLGGFAATLLAVSPGCNGVANQPDPAGNGTGTGTVALSDISAGSMTQTSAVITWSTNISAQSVVEYGLTSQYTSATPSSGLALSHSVELTGLEPGTLYHFAVSSSGTTSGDETFTTLGDALPHDAGAADAGAQDAGEGTGHDAGADAGEHSGHDAGEDAGHGGGEDAGHGGGEDAGHDAGTTDAGGGQGDIIHADFNGTDNLEIDGTSPDVVNLPGGTWHTDYVNLSGNFEAFIDSSSGAPAPALHLFDVGSSSGSAAVSISSSGSYVKPSQFSLQADIMELAPSTVLLFGFYGTLPAAGADSMTGFTGLALHTDTGDLDLVENGVTKTQGTFSGTYNAGAYNTLAYSVDTTTGGISNVTLVGQAFSFSTTAFTDAATAYVAVGSEAGGPSGACSYFDNLIVKY
jgi:hypothetical protein